MCKFTAQSWAKSPFQICVDAPSYSNPTVCPFQKYIHTRIPDTVTRVDVQVARMQKCERTDAQTDGCGLSYRDGFFLPLSIDTVTC